MIADQTLEAASVPTLPSFIDGAFDPAVDGRLIDVVDPATSRVVARIREAGPEGVERAVAAAERAFARWRLLPVRDRATTIQQAAGRISEHAERLAELDSLDTGNPLAAMRADLARGARALADSAGLGMELKGEVFPLPGLHYTRREPWGVVGRLITYNHPAMYVCGRLGPALIAGNSVVMKPSELAPLSALAIAEILADILPPGLLNVVVGGPDTAAAIVRHERVPRISFTGSVPTALRIQAAAAESGRIKTLTFELGGKNPLIAFPDVDLDEVSAAIVRGMSFARVQGQSCGSTSRVLLHESIADEVLARVATRARKITVGMPADRSTEMGAMITIAARDRALGFVERAVEAGARVLAGGGIPSATELARGAFMEPTVLDRVAPGSEVAATEVFGPVLAATTWRTEDEAIELANAGSLGLTAAIWTRDLDRALRTAERIEAGYVWINDVESRFPGVPFGGWRDSGVGLESGLEEILSFTRLRAVNIRVGSGNEVAG